MEVDGKGIQLLRGDGGDPETFTAIAQTTSQSQSGQEREIHDVTAHDTVGNRRKKRGGLVDSGDYEIELWYDPADHPTLLADFNDQDPRNYRVVFPDTAATTMEFQGIMSGFEWEGPVDGIMTANITFAISGEPQFI